MAVRIVDIAREANVSPSTVSMILNQKEGFSYSQETIEKVMSTVRRLDYQPNFTAKFMRLKKTNMIGIAVQSNNSYHGYQIVERCCDSIREFGYEPVMVNLVEPEDKSAINMFNRIDLLQGVLCVYPNQTERAIAISRRSELNLPVISLFPPAEDDSVISRNVYSDRYNDFQEAVSYLHSLGHRHIAFAGVELKDELRSFKLRGFLEGIDKLKLEGELLTQQIESGENAFIVGKSIAEKYIIKRENRFTGIVCSNDELALGLMSTALRNGIKIPEDISVVGYDDAPFAAHAFPGLTTFKQQSQEISKSAVKLLIACANGDSNQKSLLPQSLNFKSKLIVRESTAKIN